MTTVAEAPAPTSAVQKARQVRRAGLVMIAFGGAFLIFGWGLGAQPWARAIGWVLTGLGFACEMIYRQAITRAHAAEEDPENPPAKPPGSTTDESSA
ncbi:MAG: hypothetical protein ABWY19_06240 [Marmoricola sp.]